MQQDQDPLNTTPCLWLIHSWKTRVYHIKLDIPQPVAHTDDTWLVVWTHCLAALLSWVIFHLASRSQRQPLPLTISRVNISAMPESWPDPKLWRMSLVPNFKCCHDFHTLPTIYKLNEVYCNNLRYGSTIYLCMQICLIMICVLQLSAYLTPIVIDKLGGISSSARDVMKWLAECARVSVSSPVPENLSCLGSTFTPKICFYICS